MGLVRDEGGLKGHDHKLYINSVRLDVKWAIGDFFWSSLDIFPHYELLRKVTFPLQF